MSDVLCPIMWQPEDYILFRKCGEITVSPDIQCLGFNCGFCPSTCLKADVFLHHLQDQHKEDVFNMYRMENSTLDCELIQLHEVQILNNVALDANWTNIDILQIPRIAHTPNVNSQGDNNDAECAPEVVTLTSGRNALGGIEDSALVDTNNLWTKTQMESLPETNPMEYISTPLDSPSSFLYSTITTDTHGSTNPDNVCEIGDGEDSGIVVAKVPCSNACTIRGTEEGGINGGVCSGFSDCLSLNGDSSRKFPYFSSNLLEILPERVSGTLLRESVKKQMLKNNELGLFYIKSLDTSLDSWESPTTEDEIYQHMPNGEMQCSEFNKGKEKYVKTAAMRKALESREVIVCLLELYRTNEKLWNPENASYKYNARRTVYNELSKPLLQEINVNLSGVEIFSILNILRGRYRRELAKFQARKGKHRTCLWYFDNMNFLRKVIEGKRRMRLSENNEDNKTNPETEDLTNRQILSFLIEQYKQYECLWNPKDAEYSRCNKSILYDEMVVLLQQELNIVMGQKEIENEIQKLRIRYRKELRILHKLKGLYIPKLWCFDELEFLRPAMEDKILKNVNKNSRRSLALSQSKNAFLKVTEIKFPGLEQQLQFIDVYRKYASLWDVDHPDYRSANYRNIALQSMLEEVNLTLQPLKVTLDQLEKTLHLLRKDFSMEKLKRLRDRGHIDPHLPAPSTTLSLMVYEKLSAFLATNLGPFRCEDCRHMCKTYDQYKIHKSKHDGALPFICTLCGKGFQMPGNLTIHIRRHRQDFPYACEICNKSFATSTEVTIHMRSHTGERPYTCDHCGKTFKTWSFFDIHKRTHLNQSNFHCPICDKSFYERNRFTDHMNVHLNIRKHQCEHCGKGYTTISNLKKHQELHAPTKKYKCPSCDKSFAQFASLRWHKRTQHDH